MSKEHFIYSFNGAEPAPLPAGLSHDDDLEALGYILAAPKPSVATDEEVYWDKTCWRVRPVEQGEQE